MGRHLVSAAATGQELRIVIAGTAELERIVLRPGSRHWPDACSIALRERELEPALRWTVLEARADDGTWEAVP